MANLSPYGITPAYSAVQLVLCTHLFFSQNFAGAAYIQEYPEITVPNCCHTQLQRLDLINTMDRRHSSDYRQLRLGTCLDSRMFRNGKCYTRVS